MIRLLVARHGQFRNTLSLFRYTGTRAACRWFRKLHWKRQNHLCWSGSRLLPAISGYVLWRILPAPPEG